MWGTSDPTGLTGDADATGGSGGGNTLEIPQQPQFSPFSPSPAGGGLGDILGSISPGAFDPNSLAVASTGSPSGGGTDLLSLIASLLGGGGSGSSGGTGGGLNAGSLGEIGGIFQNLTSGDPFRILGGQFGGLFEQLLGLGGGLDKMAKPQGLVNLLKGSGNSDEELLGRYIQTSGINKGFDLSGSGNQPFNPRRFGDVIELLSGQNLPREVGGNVGTQNPVELSGWKRLQALQQMMPNATTLTSEQLRQIFPEIALLVNKGGDKTGGLKGLLGQENQLATKLQAAESY